MEIVKNNSAEASHYLKFLSDELKKMGFDDDEIDKGIEVLKCLKKIIGE